MDEKALFYQDKARCKIPFSHIIEGEIDPRLADVDEVYGAADVLSIRNAEEHRRVLLALSFMGTLLTLTFLLYDEAELHGLILACGAVIICLELIHHISEKLDCHRKYLQYRVLAECLRIQFFLSYAGLKTRVEELIPWPVSKGIPWIMEVLMETPERELEERHSILDCWVRDQKKYHEEALQKTESKVQRDSRIARTVFAITIVAYIVALLFELIIYRDIASLSSAGLNGAGAVGTAGIGVASADILGIDIGNADTFRAVMKIVLGTMSAITLFTGSYYGKMSLSNVIDDHKRMISLYEAAEDRILHGGEDEELILFLARECLNENSTWYAYQSKNTEDIVM